jgi:hypothetical protein
MTNLSDLFSVVEQHANEKTVGSVPASGEYKIVDIKLDSNKKIVIKYDETPEA